MLGALAVCLRALSSLSSCLVEADTTQLLMEASRRQFPDIALLAWPSGQWAAAQAAHVAHRKWSYVQLVVVGF
jgi:hypothetical protein